jgi:vacuolar-type H+-ATPase subunit E/Vma4
MGCEELISALRASGDGKVRALRAEAEQEAERIRGEGAMLVQTMRSEHERETAADAAEIGGRLLAEANAEARGIRLRAERALEKRLRSLALSALPSLRNVGYAAVFASLARELPSLAWKTIRVNPEDVDLAKDLFPGAEVVGDGSITGGFLCATKGEEIEVENTFERRLDALWEVMLPDLMRDAMELVR